MYSCVFWYEFIDFGGEIQGSHDNSQKNNYFISHTTSQWLPVMQHRLSCEKVKYIPLS